MSDLTNTYYLNSIVMEYEGDHAKVVKGRCATRMAFHHDFDPKDKRAVFVFDVFADLLDLRGHHHRHQDSARASSACSRSASAAWA